MSVCIEFKDVSYAYPLTNKAAVKHLNCKLESGKCYGIKSEEGNFIWFICARGFPSGF